MFIGLFSIDEQWYTMKKNNISSIVLTNKFLSLTKIKPKVFKSGPISSKNGESWDIVPTGLEGPRPITNVSQLEKTYIKNVLKPLQRQ